MGAATLSPDKEVGVPTPTSSARFDPMVPWCWPVAAPVDGYAAGVATGVPAGARSSIGMRLIRVPSIAPRSAWMTVPSG